MKQLTQSEIRKNGKVYKNVSSPATEGTMKQVTDIVEKDGTFSISTDGGKTYSPAVGAVPEAITESVVSGWGFTKNKGTVTSVAVKMNGTTKGTVTNSGTIDLGTVITSHQDISGKQDKLTPGDNISIVSNTISVTGLGTAAFKNTGDFATAEQGALAASAVQTVVTSTKDGNISVDGTDVAVKGLKTLAFKDSLAKADVGLGNVETKLWTLLRPQTLRIM